MLFLKRKARAQAEQILSDPSITQKDLRRLKYRLSKGQFDGRNDFTNLNSCFFTILSGERRGNYDEIKMSFGIFLPFEKVSIEQYCSEIYQGGRLRKKRAKCLMCWVERELERRRRIVKDLDEEISATQEVFFG